LVAAGNSLEPSAVWWLDLKAQQPVKLSDGLIFLGLDSKMLRDSHQTAPQLPGS